MTRSRWLGLRLFILFVCLYLLTSGGRIVSSDGNTMYLLTRSIVEEKTVAIPYGNGYPGVDGRLYPKAGIGQAILAAPFYVVGRAVYNRAGFEESERGYVMRFATACLEPFAAAIAVVLLLHVCFCLGHGVKSSLALALAFGFSTPIWVYSKGFLTEPITTALLLGSVLGLLLFKRSGRRRHLVVAGLCVGMTVLVKYAMLLAAVPIVIFFVSSCFPMKHRSSELSALSGLGRLLAFGIPLALCAMVALWYNQARFGTVLESGYGVEVSRAGFGTPLLVGLFGQLFSSGKSIFLYAPVLVLSWSGFAVFKRKFGAEALLFASVFIINVLFYSKFLSWAGDGSWGPRYLIPFVPLLLVPVGSLLSSPTVGRLTWAAFVLLAVVGFLVQVGGVSIYFGSYLREIGEYPYQREFTDPRFLSDSHFIPNYSPVYGHWKMLARNVRLHMEGEYPDISFSSYSEEGDRIPLDEGGRKELLTGLDFWFTYLFYVGKWKSVYWLIVLILGGLGTISGLLTAKTLFDRRPAFA
ncbi:MAG: hypothetical protein JSW03_09515 [Candidatus Eiseniibacteriota bacterium]|nr:MAG: hypothetical protein JSW03_09515 [Candidatus Eisenbacteria bacterium]